MFCVRYPGNYARYVELKQARLIAEDAETERARTKLRKEKEWMGRQPQLVNLVFNYIFVLLNRWQ